MLQARALHELMFSTSPKLKTCNGFSLSTVLKEPVRLFPDPCRSSDRWRCRRSRKGGAGRGGAGRGGRGVQSVPRGRLSGFGWWW